jgi:hypothetical protein
MAPAADRDPVGRRIDLEEESVRRRCLLLGALPSVAFCSMLGIMAHARTWRVERDGSGDFATIQPAIDVAALGDTIQLGPGRYAETTTTNLPGFTVQSHAVVEKGPLTFLARIPGEAIIGPTVRNDVDLGPHGISISAAAPGVTVEGLVIENVFSGIYVRSGHRGMSIVESTFRGSFEGVSAFGVDEFTILRSTFESNDGGVGIGPNARAPSITRSTFTASINHAVAFIGCLDALIGSCQITGPGTGVSVSQGSRSRCEQSTILSTARPAIEVAIDASAVVSECRLLSGTRTLSVRARSSVFVVNSVIRGGQFASVYFSGGSFGDIEHSHILAGARLAAEAASYLAEPTVRLDLTENYWGTTSVPSIAASIHDGVDDPSIRAIIDFEPILLAPVPNTVMSAGSLKAAYKRP